MNLKNEPHKNKKMKKVISPLKEKIKRVNL